MPYKKHGELFPFNLNGSFIRLIFLPPSGLYIFVLQTLEYKVYSFSTDLLKHISMNCVIIECVHITNQSFREYGRVHSPHFLQIFVFYLATFSQVFFCTAEIFTHELSFFCVSGKMKGYENSTIPILLGKAFVEFWRKEIVYFSKWWS